MPSKPKTTEHTGRHEFGGNKSGWGEVARPLGHWNSSIWHRHPTFNTNGALINMADALPARHDNFSIAKRRRPQKVEFGFPLGPHFGAVWPPLGLKMGTWPPKVGKKKVFKSGLKKHRVLEAAVKAG